jgi:hypothetical protein
VPLDQVFISYSHKDKKWRDDLDTHLTPYLRDGSITSWSDQQIASGSESFREIHSALANCKIAVLLVSPDFLASNFIHEHELGPLLKEAEQGGVQILWVSVRESAYKRTPLKNYKAVLDPGKALAAMTKAKRDQAWVKICEDIQKAVNNSGGPRWALEWDNHLGHTYRSEGTAIYTQAVQLSARNKSGRPVRLEHARLISGITGQLPKLVRAGRPRHRRKTDHCRYAASRQRP